jgi:hypothetical protein
VPYALGSFFVNYRELFRPLLHYGLGKNIFVLCQILWQRKNKIESDQRKRQFWFSFVIFYGIFQKPIGYIGHLRSVSAGRASFSMVLSHYAKAILETA